MTDTTDSQTVKAASRTYFLDIKQTKEGKNYLVITESRNVGGDRFERNSLNVFPEDAADFLMAVQEMIRHL